MEGMPKKKPSLAEQASKAVRVVAAAGALFSAAPDAIAQNTGVELNVKDLKTVEFATKAPIEHKIEAAGKTVSVDPKTGEVTVSLKEGVDQGIEMRERNLDIEVKKRDLEYEVKTKPEVELQIKERNVDFEVKQKPEAELQVKERNVDFDMKDKGDGVEMKTRE